MMRDRDVCSTSTKLRRSSWFQTWTAALASFLPRNADVPAAYDPIPVIMISASAAEWSMRTLQAKIAGKLAPPSSVQPPSTPLRKSCLSLHLNLEPVSPRRRSHVMAISGIVLTCNLIKSKFHFSVNGDDANEMAEFGGPLGPNRRKVEIFWR